MVVGIEPHHGSMPNMQDIGDPVSMGRTDAELELEGINFVEVAPLVIKEDRLEVVVVSAELEEGSSVKLESAWECSTVTVDWELLN